MKIYSSKLHFTVFLIVFAFFILPPCLTFSVSSKFLTWEFPLVNFLYAITALVIYYFFNTDKKKTLIIFPFVISLSLLLCFSFIFKGISILLSITSLSESSFFFGNSSIEVQRPDGIVQWIFCVLTFLFSAFYEEVIYRFFLPSSLITFCEKKWNGKKIIIICEVVTAVLFALAHIYLGLISVVNALAGHVVLRVCYKKFGLIIPVFLAHFSYNIISLMLL